MHFSIAHNTHTPARDEKSVKRSGVQKRFSGSDGDARFGVSRFASRLSRLERFPERLGLIPLVLDANDVRLPKRLGNARGHLLGETRAEHSRVPAVVDAATIITLSPSAVPLFTIFPSLSPSPCASWHFPFLFPLTVRVLA